MAERYRIPEERIDKAIAEFQARKGGNLPVEPIPERRIDTSVRLRKRKHFIKVPWTWHERLAEARYIVTYRLAHHVLYRHWKGGRQPFTLSNGMVAMEGIARGTKWRALRELEQLGLITIERRKRRSPRITVIE
jgi:hypothetical protein